MQWYKLPTPELTVVHLAACSTLLRNIHRSTSILPARALSHNTHPQELFHQGTEESNEKPGKLLRQEGVVLMQATANAIVQGQCLSAVAIADVLAEASVDVTADSSCGLTATAFEFDPVSDGPVADTSAEDTAAVVAETPLPNPEEEQKAEKLEETIVETTPVADVPEASDVPEVVPEEPKPEEVVPPAEPEGPRPTEPETEPDVAAPAEPVVAPAEPVVAPEEPKPVLDRQVQAGGASRVPPGDTAGPWEQCGGKGWEGPTKCVDTFVCVAQEGNIWYSQCRCVLIVFSSLYTTQTYIQRIALRYSVPIRHDSGTTSMILAVSCMCARSLLHSCNRCLHVRSYMWLLTLLKQHWHAGKLLK